MRETKLKVSVKSHIKSRKRISRALKYIRSPWLTLQPTSAALHDGRIELMHNLAPSEWSQYPAPHFVGSMPVTPCPALPKQEWAPITLNKFTNVTVIGNCNFLLHGGQAIHPDLYQPSRDRSPIELYGRARMSSTFDRIKIPLGLSHGHIDKAINLCDQTPYNYAHWLTEVLPKLALLNDLECYENLPILVDNGIAENLLESIETIVNKPRRIVKLGQYDQICIGELLNISPTSYCPHEFRDFFKAHEEGFQFFFSGFALNKMRATLRSRYARYSNGKKKKIYLKRTRLWSYNDRNIENLDEIENLIDQYDIESTNITGLTFAEQARIFMNADFIVAPTGAALANMIFAKPGCRIIVLSASYKGATYDYFNQIAHLLGHKLCFVIGPQIEDNRYHMNRNYVIYPSHLMEALDCELTSVAASNDDKRRPT